MLLQEKKGLPLHRPYIAYLIAEMYINELHIELGLPGVLFL